MKSFTHIFIFWFCFSCFSRTPAEESEPFGVCGLAFKMEDGIGVEYHNCDISKKDISAITSAEKLYSLTLGYLPEGVYFSDTSILEQLEKCNDLRSLQLVVNDLRESDLDFIFKLDSLRSLKIHSTYGQELNLTNQFAERLAKLPNLKELKISDPGITEEFKKILKSRDDWEKLVFDILYRVKQNVPSRRDSH